MKYKIEIYHISLILKPNLVVHWDSLPPIFNLPTNNGKNVYERVEVVEKKTVCIGRYLFKEFDKNPPIQL